VPLTTFIECPGIDVEAEFLQFAHLSHLLGQPPLEVDLLVEIHDLHGVVLPDIFDRLQDQIVRKVQFYSGHLHEWSIATS